ncbi:MAG: hypothetical protein Q8P80_04925 [Candidatus Levybacteria bacterium]|nr:hypothetical protein [Candidatus Levybacteria bacterium]
MNILKNKILIIVLAVVVLGGGGLFVFSQSKSSSKQVSTPTLAAEEVVPTILPADLDFTITVREDKKAIKFQVGNIKDIESVDYEVSYLAKGNIPRGAIGHADVKPGDTKIETKYIDLGTCSSGRCKYDEGVTSVKVILKITKKDGKVFQAEQSAEL